MGFRQLLVKVQQAEAALEAQERRVSAQYQDLRTTWHQAWTPGRIILVGVVSGFVIGRAQPLRAAARSGQIMQLVTMLSGLFAGGSAHVAADKAEEAADTAANTAADVADTLAPDAVATPAASVQASSLTEHIGS